jgi:hypothetical protein
MLKKRRNNEIMHFDAFSAAQRLFALGRCLLFEKPDERKIIRSRVSVTL